MAQRRHRYYTELQEEQPRRKTQSVEEKIHQLRVMQSCSFVGLMGGIMPMLGFFSIINALFKFSRKR